MRSDRIMVKPELWAGLLCTHPPHSFKMFDITIGETFTPGWMRALLRVGWKKKSVAHTREWKHHRRALKRLNKRLRARPMTIPEAKAESVRRWQKRVRLHGTGA